MKNCQVCGIDCEDIVNSCDTCGEASWNFSVDVVVDAPKKSSKKKSAKTADAPAADAPVADAPIAQQISDEEFASELANASDMDLLSLFGQENLPLTWQKMIQDEIAKRGDK